MDCRRDIYGRGRILDYFIFELAVKDHFCIVVRGKSSICTTSSVRILRVYVSGCHLVMITEFQNRRARSVTSNYF